MDARLDPYSDSSAPRRHKWVGPATLAAAFVALSAWSWRRWPDPLIDFGRELYVPWQLSEGKVLYRDIAHLNGPLSQYLNAFWFSVFGVSFSTLVIANLVLTAAATTAIFSLVRRSCDRLTATCSCMAFLCISAFAHFTFTGNYNFVCPYAHELTHGIMLSTLMILFIVSYMRRGTLVMLLASALCLGLVFLTKAEVFLAALAATIAGAALVPGPEKTSGSRTFYTWGAFCVAALLPAALFLLYFARFMPFGDALRGVAGTWQHLFTAGLLESPFYRESLGISTPGAHLAAMARATLSLSCFVAALAVWGLFAARPGKRLLPLLSALALFAVSFLIRLSPVPWLLLPETLPFITYLGAATLCAYCLKHRREPRVLARAMPLCLWAVFAFFLLGKLMLNPRFYHYGFALAMPAGIFLVILLTWFLPLSVSSLRGRALPVRLLVVLFFVADLGYYTLLSNIAYSRKTYPVGSGADALLTYGPSIDPRGPAVSKLLGLIGQTVPPRASIAVMPEGVILNYLSRRPNPTPYINFMPIELALFGEASMLRSFRYHPPDFIVFVEKDTSEYSVRPFGEDAHYGTLIADWVKMEYEAAWQPPGGPSTGHDFHVSIMKRKHTLRSND